MSTINEDLEQIKYDEDNLASSKVARFCYTEQAYQDDDYEGVPEFDPSVEQNIPLANPDTLRTNATVLDRGFRSQASSLPRMLINHFFGRVSYNLNKAHDNLVSLITTIKSFIGQPNGIASLDENGRIPYSQLPESALNLRGDWDASTNTPELSDEMEGATLGDMYYVNVGGTVDFGHGEIAFLPNDRVMYNQYNQWVKLSAGNVRKVNNKEPNTSDGNVTVYGTDINVSEEENMNIIEKIRWYIGTTMIGKYWKETKLEGEENRARFYTMAFGKTEEGKGIWVGATSVGLVWSENNSEWFFSNVTDASANRVSYKEGRWVASSSSTTSGLQAGLYASTDGKNWDFIHATARVLCLTNNDFYWAGMFYNLNPFAGYFMYSIDGETWNNVALPKQAGNRNFSAQFVSLIEDKFALVSIEEKGILYSADLSTWEDTNITTGSFTDCAYGVTEDFTKIVVACGYSNQGLKWSADGKTWNNTNITNGLFMGVTYANGIWVASSGSYSGQVPSKGILWSNDGKTWYTTNVTDNNVFYKAQYSNGVWLVPSYIGTYWSKDGQTWQKVSNDVSQVVAVGEGVWCKSNGNMATTGDGIKYSSVQDLIDNGWLK